MVKVCNLGTSMCFNDKAEFKPIPRLSPPPVRWSAPEVHACIYVETVSTSCKCIEPHATTPACSHEMIESNRILFVNNMITKLKAYLNSHFEEDYSFVNILSLL